MIPSPATIALGLSVALLALHLASLLLALPWPYRRPARIGRPAVTLIRPVLCLDPHDHATLASSFQQDHPDYRIIFCAPTAQDPACDLVRALIALNPHVPARLMTREEPSVRNPKLRNVWKGWQAAEPTGSA